MEEFGVICAVLLVVGISGGLSCGVGRSDMAQEARRCTQWYGESKTAQDSLVVASKGCEWLLVPVKE